MVVFEAPSFFNYRPYQYGGGTYVSKDFTFKWRAYNPLMVKVIDLAQCGEKSRAELRAEGAQDARGR